MTTEYVERNFEWQRALGTEHGIELLRNREDGVEFVKKEFRDDQLIAISEILLETESTRALRLEDCGLSPTNFAPIADILHVDNVLCYLYLYGNALGDEGATAIARNLRTNTSLTYLSLSKNEIGDLGVSEIAKTVESNNTLRHLFLAKNEITDKGAEFLATALKVNSGLLELVLSYNEISTDGDIALAEAIRVNRTLTSLSIHQHQDKVTPRGAKALIDALQVNETITFYGLGIEQGQQRIAKRAKRLLNRNQEKQSKRQSRRRENFTSVLTEGAERYVSWNRCKLMIVGEGRSGKTATVRALQGSIFTENLRSTIGARVVHLQTQQRARHSKWRTIPKRKGSLLTSLAARLSISREREEQKKVQPNLDQNIRISIRRVRTRSRTRSRSRSRSSTVSSADRRRKRSSNVVSLTRRVSNNRLDSREARKLSIKSRLSKGRSSSVGSHSTNVSTAGSSNQPVVSVEKEVSNMPPIVSKERAESLAKDQIFIEAAEELDDKAISFTIWDYGGQDVFYPLHHLFLSKYGIYTVVFSMQSLIQEEAKTAEYISFWLNSIKIHAPTVPVFIVGTFLDKVPNSIATLERMNKIVRKLIFHFPQVIHNQKEDLVYFPITNTNSDTIKFFRASVEKAARAQRFVKKKVDLRWVGLLENILEFTLKDKKHISFKRCCSIANKLGLKDPDETKRILNFFHDYGLLVYLDSTLILSKRVTINPQWLIDKISSVIRDTKLHKVDVNSLDVKGLLPDAKKLETQGIISQDLLEFFWHETEYDFLLDLMKQTMLLSEYYFTNEKEYLVPSMIQHKASEFKSLPHSLYLNFNKSYLPQGVFERVICLFVNFVKEKKSVKEPVLFVNQAKFYFNQRVIVLKRRDREIEVSCVDVDANAILKTTEQIMKNINRQVFKGNLTFEIFVTVDEERVELETAAAKQLAPWFAVDTLDISVDIEQFLNV